MAVTDERVSRRRLLKRAGVGAAVLGAGSLVTAGTASAAGNCNAGECHACTHTPSCTDGHHGTGGCVPTTEGCCFCHEPSFCFCLPSCTASSQCPPGWACAMTCCGGFLCVPPLGETAPCNVAAGPMTMGGASHHGGHHSEPEVPDGGHGGHGGGGHE
jgi:hypothetical protein